MNFNMSISENIQALKNTLPKEVTLVAVSKTKPNEAILEAYNTGHRVFGENKIQELVTKNNSLPKDIEWHMIGHLQRNKVKYIASFVSLIHAVDSLRLLTEINKQAIKNNRIINCLLQVKIATEESKFGLSKDEIVQLLESDTYKNFQNINIVGLMGMATFTNNEEQLQNEFNSLQNLYLSFRKEHTNFKNLSMGMSNDYKIAIKNGSTMIRVGSSIFGHRNYSL